MKMLVSQWHSPGDVLPENMQPVVWFTRGAAPDDEPYEGRFYKAGDLHDDACFVQSWDGHADFVPAVEYWAKYPRRGDLP